VKTLRDELLHDERVVDLFRKEALIWIDLGRHPHIVQAKFVDEAHGRLFIAMEFIPPNDRGLNDLDGYLERQPPDLGQSLFWAVEFCHGMEYANQKGVRCHRDVKPPNILIAADGRVRITDFGIAGVILARGSAAPTSAMPAAAGVTMAGGSVGTPTHMPPEQFVDAASCDARSDIYSFGIVLFQMATRRLPFEMPRVPAGPEAMARMWAAFHRQHLEAPVPRIDSPLKPIIDRCLEKDPSRRYPSFVALRSDVQTLLQEKTGERVQVAAPLRPEVLDWVNKGLSFTSLGELDEALRCYDQALALDPNVKEALNNKGNCLRSLGRLDESVRYFDRALSIDPAYRDAYLNKAISLVRMREPDSALLSLDKALEIDPRMSDAWVTKGVAHASLGRDDLALECYEKALAIDPKNAIAWFNRGAKLHAGGRLDEALECIESSLGNDPRYLTAWIGKGVLLGDMGRHPEALQALERATVLAPEDPMGWYNKGNTLLNLDRVAEARDSFVRATELNPRFPLGWNNRALAEVRLERFDDAKRSFESFLAVASPEDRFRPQVESLLARLRAGERVALGSVAPGETTFSSDGADEAGDRAELDRLREKFLSGEKLTDDEYVRIDELLAPTDAIIREALGITAPAGPTGDARELQGFVSRAASLLHENQVGPALDAYDRALAIDRGCAEAWSGRGECLYRAERFADALASFDRALALHRGNDRAWLLRGHCLGRLGKCEDAVESFARSIEIDPGVADAHYGQSVCLLHLGRFQEALAASERAGEFPPAVHVQARCLHALKRHEEALAGANRFLEHRSGDPQMLYVRASALDETGRREEALAAYREFVSKATNQHATLSQRARDRIAALSGPAGSGVPIETSMKRAVVNRNQKQYVQAAHYFEEALAVDPNHVPALLGSAECLSLLSRHEEALRVLDRAVNLAPESAEAWHQHGAALLALSRADEAVASLTKSTSLDPGKLLAWVSRGEALLQTGRHDEALVCLDAALAKDSRCAIARFHKAGAEERLGRKADAARSFQLFLSTAPPNLARHIQLARARLSELRKP
jgi:tetratricopeptide (TPR) repeat protein